MAKRDPNNFAMARQPSRNRYRTERAWRVASGTGYNPPEEFWAVFGKVELTPRQLGLICRAWAAEVYPKMEKVKGELLVTYFLAMKLSLDAGTLEQTCGK